jgi:hypothetical protein
MNVTNGDSGWTGSFLFFLMVKCFIEARVIGDTRWLAKGDDPQQSSHDAFLLAESLKRELHVRLPYPAPVEQFAPSICDNIVA